MGNVLKYLASTLVVGGVVCAFVVAGVAANATPLMRKALPDEAAVSSPAPLSIVETDRQRRERLNTRLHDMIASGKGARLSDGRALVSSSRQNREAVLRPTVGPSRPGRPETSTIAPPAYRVGSPSRSSSGYRPPILDLRTPASVPSNDIECLTQALYYEARNESEDGQAAVAEVVMNRSRSGAYPRSVCQVVYQRNSRTCQFTFTCDGSIGRSAINMTAWGRAERIARDVYEGRSSQLLPNNSVNYHANYVRPSWGRQLQRVRQIGAHIFYGAPLSGGSTPGAQPAPAPATKPTERGLQFVRIEAIDRAFARFSETPTDGSK